MLIFKRVVFIIAFLFVTILFAQPNFTKHYITRHFQWLVDVCAIDLDSDNDMDVLAVGEFGTLGWWENDDTQTFIYHQIGSQPNGDAVRAIDMDNDFDVDILVAGFDWNGGGWSEINWRENDGNQNFTRHLIADSSTFYGAVDVYAIDMDSDNDIDVIGSSWVTNEIAWWENDGSQNFTKHTIDSSFSGAFDVCAIDIGNDNDVDVVGAAYRGNEIAWWENDGSQGFTKHIISTAFAGACQTYPVDMDNDTDVDIIGAAWRDEIAWWENDGNQSFTKHTISFTYGPYKVDAIDVDNDSDVDILEVGRGAGGNYYLLWWENDGNQNFSHHFVDTDPWIAIHASDMDNDTDADILVGDGSDEISWFESDLVGIAEKRTSMIRANDLVTTIIGGSLLLPADRKCKIFDITGRVVAPDKIKAGIYFIEIDDVISRKVVKIR